MIDGGAGGMIDGGDDQWWLMIDGGHSLGDARCEELVGCPTRRHDDDDDDDADAYVDNDDGESSSTVARRGDRGGDGDGADVTRICMVDRVDADDIGSDFK